MNLKNRILLVLYKYGSMNLKQLKQYIPDVKYTVLKEALWELSESGKIIKTGSRRHYLYDLSDTGRQFLENEYLKHRFYELQLIDNMLLFDLNMR
jgi:DNA-binding HxlR family transcriptional regulator